MPLPGFKATARLSILCFTLCLAAFTEAPAQEASKTLRCGWYHWDPYQHTIDRLELKQLTGLDVELVRTTFEDMGYEVLYDEVTWSQHQLDVKEGKRDIAAGAFQNEERAAYAYYSAPYRTETDVLYVRRADAERFRFQDPEDLMRLFTKYSAKLGIVDGFYYGPVVTRYIEDPANASRIIEVGNEVSNFQNLLSGKIDAFIIDRLVAATLTWRHGWRTQVAEISPPVFSASIHVIFSKKSTTPALVDGFNRKLEELRDNGTYAQIVREYLLPVLLGATAGQHWFFVVDIIGTIAFAMSGVLLARRGRYSLFGAFVLASLPAVGGGIMRDAVINRETPVVLTTPAYLIAILFTVFICYILFNIKTLWSKKTNGVATDENSERMLLGRISNNTAVAFFDSLGLSAFTIIGVVVALEARIEPLWLWGPLLGALTGAGGGILRDVIRADADNPGLKGAFYAEVSLIWGFILSLFLLWYANSLVHRPSHITMMVVISLVGGVVTRLAVFYFRIRSPMF
jgi:polar amino acid transport system substrate-binding protein